MRNREEKIKNLLKGVTFGLLVIALIIMAAGCDKKKGNGSSQTPYGYGPGGTIIGGPGGYGPGSLSAAFDNNGRYRLILSVAADPNQQQGGSFGTGLARVQGELQLFTPMGCGYQQIGYPPMGLDAGRYIMEPYQGQPAQISMSGDFLSNVVLVARGPRSEAIVTIPYAKIFQTNVCGYDGMQGGLNVEMVNGVRCGLTTGFTDQVNPGMCR